MSGLFIASSRFLDGLDIEEASYDGPLLHRRTEVDGQTHQDPANGTQRDEQDR